MGYTEVVSQVVPVGFADLACAAEELSGWEAPAGRARLQVQGPYGRQYEGMVRLGGVLRTGSLLLPKVRVEVIVSPWSAGRSEVAIHPITNLGQFDSLRANRFFEAARAVLPALVDHLSAEAPVEAPKVPALAA